MKVLIFPKQHLHFKVHISWMAFPKYFTTTVFHSYFISSQNTLVLEVKCKFSCQHWNSHYHFNFLQMLLSTYMRNVYPLLNVIMHFEPQISKQFPYLMTKSLKVIQMPGAQWSWCFLNCLVFIFDSSISWYFVTNRHYICLCIWKELIVKEYVDQCSWNSLVNTS